MSFGEYISRVRGGLPSRKFLVILLGSTSSANRKSRIRLIETIPCKNRGDTHGFSCEVGWIKESVERWDGY